MKMDFRDRLAREPDIDPTAYVAPTAVVLGDVKIGPDASVWFHCILRGEANAIRVGARSNIQDMSVLHGDHAVGDHAVILGEDVSIGHGAIIHGCTIGDRVLVGMGAVILNAVTVGADSIIAAGAIVREGMDIPPRSLVVGVPAKIRREITDDDISRIHVTGAFYLEYKDHYMDLGEDRIKAMMRTR